MHRTGGALLLLLSLVPGAAARAQSESSPPTRGGPRWRLPAATHLRGRSGSSCRTTAPARSGYGERRTRYHHRDAPELVPARGTAARWTDYRFMPLVGSTVERGAPIDLLWETYDAATAGGRSRLRIAVAVQRETAGGLRAVAGRVVGGLRNAVTGSTGGNQTTITYEREYEAAPGRYLVSLTVTDLIRGDTVSRLQRFAIDR